MQSAHLVDQVEAWANLVLVWVGFGTVVGLLARVIIPGRDATGPVATIAMGIGGVVIGCGALAFFLEGERVTPLSVSGFIVATLGASLILFFHRLLAGRVINEGVGRRAYVRRSSRRVYLSE